MNNKTARRLHKKLKEHGYRRNHRENMVKKAHIVVRLVPEASKVANESLKVEIEKEIMKAVYVIPWADSLESIEIKESGKSMVTC